MEKKLKVILIFYIVLFGSNVKVNSDNITSEEHQKLESRGVNDEESSGEGEIIKYTSSPVLFSSFNLTAIQSTTKELNFIEQKRTDNDELLENDGLTMVASETSLMLVNRSWENAFPGDADLKFLQDHLLEQTGFPSSEPVRISTELNESSNIVEENSEHTTQNVTFWTELLGNSSYEVMMKNFNNSLKDEVGQLNASKKSYDDLTTTDQSIGVDVYGQLNISEYSEEEVGKTEEAKISDLSSRWFIIDNQLDNAYLRLNASDQPEVPKLITSRYDEKNDQDSMVSDKEHSSSTSVSRDFASNDATLSTDAEILIDEDDDEMQKEELHGTSSGYFSTSRLPEDENTSNRDVKRSSPTSDLASSNIPSAADHSKNHKETGVYCFGSTADDETYTPEIEVSLKEVEIDQKLAAHEKESWPLDPNHQLILIIFCVIIIILASAAIILICTRGLCNPKKCCSRTSMPVSHPDVEEA